MARPTIKQRLEEAEKLKDLKPKIGRTTFFGDDNRAAIDAQLDVLEKNLSHDDIYDRGPESAKDDEDATWTQHQLEAALEARQWLDSESEDGPPSEGWKELVKE